MKKNTKYVIIQILATIILICIIILMLFMWALFLGKTPDLIEHSETQSDANINAVFNILTVTVTTVTVAIFSIYNLYLLRKRKKLRDFSPLKKKEIILLLLPILYYPIMFGWAYMWVWILSPLMTQAVTIIDVPKTPLCCATPEPSLFGIEIIASTISWLTFPIMFAPWFSFIGYMRKKALKK